MKRTYTSIETKLIHAGEPKPLIHGAVNVPIFQSSTYEFSGERPNEFVRYIRYNNTPNHLALHQKLAALENGEAAVITASGMAAISTSLLTVLSPGEHVIFQDCLYGGTLSFVAQELPRFGISYDFFDSNVLESWKSKLRPNTRAIYVESISNPLMQVIDLKAIVTSAREFNLVSLIDNTFTSPINFRPLEIGFDISIHSGTKYLNGHSDIVAGAVISRTDLIEQISQKLINYGGTLDPHACYLLHRGLKTLAVRMIQQNKMR